MKMKKIFTKISLLCIGLMLCAGNAWADGTYNDPANPNSGQDYTGCYYEETDANGITYRVDYTYVKTVQAGGAYTIKRTPATLFVSDFENDYSKDYKYINAHAYVTNVFTGSSPDKIEFVSSISFINDISVNPSIPEPMASMFNWEKSTTVPVCLKKSNFNGYSGKIKLPAYPSDGIAIVYEGWSVRDERYTDANYGDPFTYVFGNNVTVEVPKFSDQARYNAQKVDYYGTALNPSGSAYNHASFTGYPWNGHLTNRGEDETLSYVDGGQIDNTIYWVLYGDGRLQITGSGAIPDVLQGATPWNAHIDGIYAVEIGAGITAIGNYAFYNCSNLTEITFGGTSVTRIGNNCFQSCAKLQKITFPSGVTTLGTLLFDSDDYLMSVSLPATISTMPASVFGATHILNTVTILNTDPTNTMDELAFNGITTLIIPDAAICAYKDLWSDKTYVSYTSGEELDCVNQTCGENLNWAINDGVLTISGTGTTMDNYSSYTDVPWYSRKNEITAIVFDAPNLENIGNYAFYQLQNAAFTEVTIPNSVVSIGNYAFRYCNNLTAIHLGSAVRNIGSSAFANTGTLTEPICNGYVFVKMPTSYSGAYTIQAGTVEIKSSAFSGCTGLTSVTIPSSVTTMGSGVFSGCTSLTSASFPSALTTIEAQTYYGCTNLTSVTIPNNVTTIGASAFEGCTSLSSVILGASVNSIGANAFKNCPLSEPLKTETKFFVLPTNYSGAYEIPDGIVNISATAFNGCTGLTAVSIPNTVTTIGNEAFKGCNNASFTEVTIPHSVTTIGTGVFYNCNKLASVTMPRGITAIPREMFYGCTSLSQLHMRDVPPTSIGTNAFKNVNNVTFYVPKGTYYPYEDFLFDAGYSYDKEEENIYGDVTAINVEYSYWASWYDDDPTVTTYKDAAYNALVESASTHESVENFTIVRPIQANGYLNTICLPFDLSEAQIANSDLAGAEIFAFDAQNTGAEIEMVLNEVTEMEAGMPYFFRYPNGTAETPNLGELNFHNVTVKTATTTPKTVDAGTFRLRGTLQNTLLNSATNYLFLGAEDALFYPDFGGVGVTNDDLTLRPFRAYFEQTGGNSAPARIKFGTNTATGVENAQSDKVQTTKVLQNGQLFIIKNGVKYNAQGQIVK